MVAEQRSAERGGPRDGSTSHSVSPDDSELNEREQLNVNNNVSALSAVDDATAFSSAEKQKLVALLQAQLDDTCHASSNAAHNIARLRRSLEDQVVQDNKAMNKANDLEFSSSSDVVERADLSEAEKSLAAVRASLCDRRP